MTTLQFWFDFASTYSYLSAMRIEALAAKHHVTVKWMPFLLGPIFADNGWNTSPFNIYQAKGRYMWRDMERQAENYGIPFRRPVTFPQFTLTAARIGVAARDEPWLPDFCRTLFAAEYGRGGDVSTPEASAEALRTIGQDPSPWLARAGDPETKQTLKDRVEDASGLGIFGAPTFVATDGELFWGDDRLEAAVAWEVGNQCKGH